MAAPTPTTRAFPGGNYLKDGYQTLVTLAVDPDASFWEIGVTPPGYDGGDPIDTTTMHNVRWRTMAARALISMTPISVRGAYDPFVYDLFLSIVNIETTVTVTFPDGTTLAFYGFLQNFEPDELAEGELPEATFTVQPTNQDPSTGAEENPVLNSATGT